MTLENEILNILNSNFKYNNNIESYIGGKNPGIFLEFSNEELNSIAAEEDDFEIVLGHFEDIIKKSGRVSLKDKKALREANGIYVDTQKKLAKIFGDCGQFEYAEKHLKNAHIGFEIDFGYSGKLKVEPTIKEREVKEILDNAIRNTAHSYFLQKANDFSEEGDVENFEKYISLTLKSLKEDEKISSPGLEDIGWKREVNNDNMEKIFRLNMAFRKMHKKAYQVALIGKMEMAIANGINENKYMKNNDIRIIEDLSVEIKCLLLDYIKKIIPDRLMSEAFSDYVDLFNSYLNPVFDELIDCRGDLSHPIRSIYKQKRKDKGDINRR